MRQVQAERDCPVSPARSPHRGVRQRSGFRSEVGRARRTAHASRQGCRRCRPARHPTADSETSACRLCALRSAKTKLSDKVFKLVVCNIRAPPRRNIRPALAGCPLQSLELCVLESIPVLDEAQPFTQNLAGVLVASRLNQCLDELLLVLAQNHVTGGHVIAFRKGEHKLARSTLADYANDQRAARHPSKLDRPITPSRVFLMPAFITAACGWPVPDRTTRAPAGPTHRGRRCSRPRASARRCRRRAGR